jgi:hypothetical protein
MGVIDGLGLLYSSIGRDAVKRLDLGFDLRDALQRQPRQLDSGDGARSDRVPGSKEGVEGKRHGNFE